MTKIVVKKHPLPTSKEYLASFLAMQKSTDSAHLILSKGAIDFALGLVIGVLIGIILARII